MSILSLIVKKIAWKTGKFKGLYLKVCKPNGFEYANYLRKWGNYYSIGTDCSIKTYTNITDTQYVRIGNNVQLSNCSIFGHDGSISCLNRAYNKILDRVGKIDIRDNVYIGHGAIILPGVTIGPNAIIGAGAVVAKTVPPDSIVVGNPGKIIGSVDELVGRLEASTKELPWYSLLEQRGVSGYDPEIEPALKKMRIAHFYKDSK
ncbi:acyltransferase [Marinagarivorans cellulosilyticus]|uniref:Acyltransferase n=1 Tax=Marinagarivorans cellulosilyticus TaxID=2721545 RepID=A0AAN2BM49_9GAMM|nr:acyltransferase [Marinagarivorans cellulosilyticus]BCD99692.1 hypothetical protein MARGE09_P3894 [Marinagarivorans cellulosilyticus]